MTDPSCHPVFRLPSRVGRSLAPALALALAAALAAPAAVRAQPGAPLDPGTAAALNQGRLVLELGAWGELTLRRAGAELDPGYFCGGCAEIFAGSPMALDAADTYRTMHLVGVPLYAVGLAALIADLIGVLADPNDFVGLYSVPFWTLLGGGFAVGMTGAMLMTGARAYLSDAVNRYNDDLFAAARVGRPFPLGLRLAPQPGGLALGFSGTF
jgi:hypothetical protein